MSAITVDKLMSNPAIGEKFDQSFVEKMVNALPEIMSIDQDELTFGTAAKKAKVPRGQAGKFLKAAANVKGWAIDVVNGKPHKKDTKASESKAQESSQSSKEESKQKGMSDPTEISKAILTELQRPPMDEEIGFTFASVPHLAEITGAPENLVKRIVDHMTNKGMIKQYEGEIDFEEKVFMLSSSDFEKAREEAKSKKQAATVEKTVTQKPSKEAEVKETSTDKKEEKPTEVVEELNKKTLEAVRRALKQDKFTRNGIINKVAKKGVHKRADVTNAFEFLIQQGEAKPTNDGGAREYFAIPSKEKKQEAVSTTKDTATPSTEVASSTKEVTTTEKTEPATERREDKKAPVIASNNDESKDEMGLITSSIKALLSGAVTSLHSGSDLASIRKKLKAALTMIDAAEELK